MSETKVRGRLAPLQDELPLGHLPEPVPPSPEQIAAQAEADERDRQRQHEWAMINQALTDNSMAVTRAISRWHSRPGERESRTEQVMTGFENGSFLLDRLGAGGVIDQDLAVVLLHFRQGLIDEYGDGPAALMLIDRAVAAYQDFIRVAGWGGNLAISIEHEFFGMRGPSWCYEDRYGREGPTIRGLTVEQHLARMREELIPLAERCGRVMREALAALAALRAGPSEAIERSRPAGITFDFRARG